MINSKLFRLLHLADPNLPIGGFAHSAGLETYVQKGIVKNKQTAKSFVVAQLSQNIQYTDAAILALSFAAFKSNDWNTLIRMDDLCTAVKLPRELREASQKLGIRLLKIVDDIFNKGIAEKYKQSVFEKTLAGHYCIVFGLYTSLLEIDLEDALIAFYYNAAVSMVTNAVKLVPLGQQEGQEILLSINDLIQSLAKGSLNQEEELIGRCCAGFDIRSMQHEHLYSRLYMS